MTVRVVRIRRVAVRVLSPLMLVRMAVCACKRGDMTMLVVAVVVAVPVVVGFGYMAVRVLVILRSREVCARNHYRKRNYE